MSTREGFELLPTHGGASRGKRFIYIFKSTLQYTHRTDRSVSERVIKAFSNDWHSPAYTPPRMYPFWRCARPFRELFSSPESLWSRGTHARTHARPSPFISINYYYSRVPVIQLPRCTQGGPRRYLSRPRKHLRRYCIFFFRFYTV